jgi:hypothetical protein
MDFQVGMAPKIGTTYRSLAACQSYLPFAEDHLCAIDRAYQKLALAFPVVFIQASDQYCCGYLLCKKWHHFICYDFDFFLIMITRIRKIWGVSANLKPYMNYWSRDSYRIYFWKWVSRWHMNQHGLRFSRNHFTLDTQ